MPQMIFVNLPVTDLARSVAFYEAVGATRHLHFSDETATCMVFSDAIHLMLMTHAKFAEFCPRPIADAREVIQVLLCLTAASRAEVDGKVEAAVSAGGKADPSKVDEYEMMYGRSFEDPDGHLWGINWMDPAMMGSSEAETA
ncbi:VOC family protein [Aquabacter sp. CN5-332]|uniref:VOC family protein n=1 Tax=Aquabacter sp. CN5-332 TaxID=3156608 RepID=UPI0032B4D486